VKDSGILGLHNAKVVKVFRAHDSDGNGVLNKSELGAALLDVGADENGESSGVKERVDVQRRDETGGCVGMRVRVRVRVRVRERVRICVCVCACVRCVVRLIVA
jgi:hypothetical protein